MEFFWDNLKSYGENTALVSEDETVSYEQLCDIADKITENVPERSFAFLVCKNQIASVTGYIAFLRKRVAVALISPTIDSELLEKLLDIYKPQFIWCPNDFIESAGENSYGGYKMVSTGNPCPTMNSELAVLVTTSGSTGSPKFVRLSYKNIQANTEAITEILGILPSDKAITTLPMYYVYGLSIIQSHLMNGASVILTEKNIFDIQFWELFKRNGATTFGAVPYTYEILDKLHFLNMELPSLRYITQAGGNLGKTLHSKIAVKMAEKDKKFVVMYGASEATARMSYVPVNRTVIKAGSIGVAIPGGKFELIDFEGNVISKPNKVGELVYYGPNVMMGYANSVEDLRKADKMQGRLATGDLAQRDTDGFYYIVGRKNRFVKIFGNRVNLAEIEELLAEKGYDDVACMGDDDRIRIFTTSSKSREIVDFISKKTGLNPIAFAVITVPEIPRNQAGKILYSQL